MIKVTPKTTSVHNNKLVKKFYDKGILTLKSEYDKKSGKLLKDVFMNTDGTKPIRITKYDSNEKLATDTFFSNEGKYIASIDYKDVGQMLDFIL